MTQVLTVSANTAAYAMEVLKPPPRVPNSQLVKEAVRAFERARNDGDDDASAGDAIRAASAELSMMNFNDHHPQGTIRQVLDAYRDIVEDAPETETDERDEADPE